MSRPAPFEFDLQAIESIEDPAERKQAFAEVALFKRKMESNLLWSYVPHEGEREYKLTHNLPLDGHESRGQQEYHEVTTPVGAAVAGNRFGKTTGGVVDRLIQTIPPEFLPPWLLPYKRWGFDEPIFGRVVVVDIPQALTKVMLPAFRAWTPPAALEGGSWEKGWNERTRMLRFANGSWIDFLTHDMPVDAYAGAALHWVYFDEEPPGERGKLQYDESLVRLIDYDGEVRFTLTPLLGLNWVYYELTEDDVPRQDDEVHVVTGDMDHNPHLSSKQKERLERRWAKEPLKLAARKHGRFVHFAGKVYDEFREDRHVIPDRPIPRRDANSKPSVPIYAAIDPGIDHPAALVFAWIDTEDVMEVFYAEKWRDFIMADLATRFHAVCEEHSFRPRWTVVDPSMRNRNFETGRNVQQVLSEHGIHTLPGQNARIAGFDRIKERLRTDRLVVHASCEALVDEFRTYRWKQKPTSSEDEGRAGEVIKRNDDLLDALRYLAMSMPSKAASERAEPTDESAAQRAFKHSLKRLGKKRRVRVGDRV